MTQPAEPESPRRRKRQSALSSPAFRDYFWAACGSTFGLWIMRFMLGWMAWALTESALWVGIITGSMLAPTFIMSPIFGVIADRINLRRGLFISLVLQTLIGLVAGLAYYAGWLDVTWLVVLAVAKGIVTSAHHPLRLSMMPRLIDRTLLPSGIGLSAMVFNTSRIIGPAVGAGLLTITSSGFVFMVASGLFAVASGLIIRLPSLPAAQTEGEQASIGRDLLAGLRFALAQPAIRLILTLAMVNGFLGRTVLELLPALSGQLLAGDANTLALLTALAGVGSILGGLIMSRQRGRETRLVRLVFAALVFSSLMLMPMLLVSQLLAVSVMILLLSLSTTITGTGCQALTQLTVADAYRGRVLSLWTVITMGTPAIGAFAMGALADSLGFGLVLSLFAVLAVGTIVLLLPHRHAVHNR